MPDLQSELSKVITEWETPEMPTTDTTSRKYFFKPTNNVSRVTFDHIRDNPGTARAVAVRALVAAGFKKGSVSSLLVQMARQGMIREANGGLFVTQPAYTPIKFKPAKPKAKPAPAAPVAKRKYTRRSAAAKAAAYEEHENYNPTALHAEPKVVASPEFNAEDFVNALTLKQAKAVYSELKKVFE